jgi:hypothetical protein
VRAIGRKRQERKMPGNIEKTLKDPEKRAKTLFWIWILSMVFTAIGYIFIFYLLYWKK